MDIILIKPLGRRDTTTKISSLISYLYAYVKTIKYLFRMVARRLYIQGWGGGQQERVYFEFLLI